ncbi:O-antigen ligase family protein [Larkinella soli]|uniref:O-antigen ligase family protein n=1 Tax=Larkinella soli TaxID=1770527 RepID=UPI000FFB7F18|nr:O-antigen ligase family protein [Larkinella soli]
MMSWIFRILMTLVLFGVNCISYGGDQTSVVLEMVTNGVALMTIPCLVLLYFHFPGIYKLAAWLILIGVFLLIMEALHVYNQSVYSPFVIKRFSYCGLAIVAYCIVSKATDFSLKKIIWVIFILFFFNQVVLGKILTYALTSETRTTAAPEALYLVLPLVYFLDIYLKRNSTRNMLAAIATLSLIFFLLHRSVISTAVVATLSVFFLSILGKTERIKTSNIFAAIIVFLIVIPLSMSIFADVRFDEFYSQISGIISPKEDNTGSWRYEQSIYYWAKILEKPLLGWRYVGYDHGEVMVEENFAEKGTYIHSQYIDMLYNYGIAGLGLNLLIIFSALYSLYRRNDKMSSEQVGLFAFIAGGLAYGISYQLPVFYWAFVGMGMYYGLNHELVFEEAVVVTEPAASTPHRYADNQV